MQNFLAFPHFEVTSQGAWLVLAVALSLYMIASLILEYHWDRYGMNDSQINRMRHRYYLGTAFFAGLAFFAAVWYAFL